MVENNMAERAYSMRMSCPPFNPKNYPSLSMSGKCSDDKGACSVRKYNFEKYLDLGGVIVS